MNTETEFSTGVADTTTVILTRTLKVREPMNSVSLSGSHTGGLELIMTPMVIVFQTRLLTKRLYHAQKRMLKVWSLMARSAHSVEQCTLNIPNMDARNIASTTEREHLSLASGCVATSVGKMLPGVSPPATPWPRESGSNSLLLREQNAITGFSSFKNEEGNKVWITRICK